MLLLVVSAEVQTYMKMNFFANDKGLDSMIFSQKYRKTDIFSIFLLHMEHLHNYESYYCLVCILREVLSSFALFGCYGLAVHIITCDWMCCKQMLKLMIWQWIFFDSVVIGAIIIFAILVALDILPAS